MDYNELPVIRWTAEGECECDWHLGFDVRNPHED